MYLFELFPYYNKADSSSNPCVSAIFEGCQGVYLEYVLCYVVIGWFYIYNMAS